jgi:hypothetical protein
VKDRLGVHIARKRNKLIISVLALVAIALMLVRNLVSMSIDAQKVISLIALVLSGILILVTAPRMGEKGQGWATPWAVTWLVVAVINLVQLLETGL